MKHLEIEYPRYLKMRLPSGQSAFLWGARKTGKSFYLKRHFPDSVCYDLLETDLYFRLLKEPHLFREEVLALSEAALSHPIIVDEIQKIPVLLDEVHWLIENSAAYFILCGSSARKLKNTGVNLLGGRAWRYEFFPLVYPEIEQFDLLQALQRGLIPSHYHAKNWSKTARSYVNDYLKEEIKAESLVRNLAAFAQFLDRHRCVVISGTRRGRRSQRPGRLRHDGQFGMIGQTRFRRLLRSSKGREDRASQESCHVEAQVGSDCGPFRGTYGSTAS